MQPAVRALFTSIIDVIQEKRGSGDGGMAPQPISIAILIILFFS